MTRMWRLLKLFRRDLLVFMGVEVVLVLIIAVNDIRLQRPESVLDSLGVSAFLAAALTLCVRATSRLNRMPFPVSTPQRAMLPVVFFTLFWVGGMAAMFAGALCFRFSADQWGFIWAAVLQRFPFYFLAFLFVYRLFSLSPHLLGGIFVALFLPQIMEDADQALWGTWYFLILPAALALIAFYLVEIPEQLAVRDRLLVAQGPNQVRSWMRDLHLEPRHTWITWVGRVMDAVLFFAVVVGLGILAVKSFGRDLIRVQTYLSKPWLSWYLLCGLFFGIALYREGYGRAAASGFGPFASMCMGFMRFTILLNPLTKALGVKKGVVAQCDQCRNSKFVWARHCPHCGFPGQGTIMNKQMARLAHGDTLRITPRRRFLVRLFIPLQLFIMFGAAGRAGSRPFEAHTLLLRFQSAQVAAKAAEFVQDWIKTRADAGTWLQASVGQGPVPQKYRLQVVYYRGNAYMTVEAYGLRWDSAASLPDLVADHLGRALPEARSFTVSPMKPHQARSPFMQARTYLDNRLHWVQRDPSTSRILHPQKDPHNVSESPPRVVN